MLNDPVVIVSAARTPMGAFQGELKACSAPQLGATAIAAALTRAGITPTGAGPSVGEVLMGCVLPAGLGQAPARQAALGAGLPDSTTCSTINKMCGSGMKAVMLAHDQLVHAGLVGAGSETPAMMLAGGMESMSNAPYLLPRVRAGLRMGHGQVLDHMFLDGLEDAYEPGRLMGSFAEDCADRYGFSRAEQDAFALRSLERALQASHDGHFDWEIAPVTLPAKRGAEAQCIRRDESPFSASAEKIPLLKPAFRADGTVTAANASSISDGAAALLLMRRSSAEQLGMTPLALIVGHASHAQAPGWFSTAPVGAIAKLFDRTGWRARDVDLYEINEAFAVVTLAAMKELQLPAEKVNIHGGACALGHPIGASGARILVSLIGALRRSGGRRGVASLCIGGGEATAMAIELV
jgi:acetyl-CoA C-acetyltransferase